MTYIYTVRAVIEDADWHKAFEGYCDMPDYAFSTLDAAIAFVQKGAGEELDELDKMMDNDEPSDEALSASRADRKELRDMPKLIRYTFKKFKKGDLPIAYFTCAGYVYLFYRTELDPKE